MPPQVDLPPDEPPTSEGERHSRERIAQPTRLDRARRTARALILGPVMSSKNRTRWLRVLLAPLVLALVPGYWVADATHRASLATIGRDQGIFHYIAWAVLRGDVDYRDVRDVNGPLVHLIHMMMLRLGAADEHRFHVIDLAATSISFAIVGLLLPGIITRRAPSWIERLGWAFAAWVVLAGQYALFLYWNQAQRESFCDWFLLPSIAIQIARPAACATSGSACRVSHTADAKSASRRIILLAALSTITWFGKSSFVVFTVMQLGCLLVDRELQLGLRAKLWAFFVGGILGAAIPLLYLFRYGDILAFLQIALRDVPQVYRFIWARSAPDILGEEGPLGVATMGLAISALLATLIVVRALPRRMLALALAPIAGLASAVAQKKGFGYHFHPLTATTHIGCMVVVIMLWERFRFAPSQPRRSRFSRMSGASLGRLIAIGVIVSYALMIASNMRMSPHTRNVWILAGGETEEKRLDKEYFDSFKSHDFFPWELRQGARYLTDVTKPDARVQVYGMDPYILFLARRRSATPYIYAYDLNADAALDGGWSNKPTWPEILHILAVRNAHERDMLARLKEAPPEAFVFIDRAPLISYPDAWEDFRHCCTESATWVATHYHAARTFGDVHVWLRDDMPVPDQEESPKARPDRKGGDPSEESQQ